MPSNRLIHEKSPYLIQHAHNPVDWYPWSDEAFEMARKHNKPVFLSIGYATCHWCHVMEKESFEDTETAAYLNDTFVCIKVDREERPDIDSVYMIACQMLTGSGGWPLTIFMTPDKKPFFAATYLPKHSRFGRAGLIELSAQIKTIWASQDKKILESADNIAAQLERAYNFSASEAIDETVFGQAYAQLEQSYDSQFYGFNPAPKFPTPHRLLFLLRYHHRTGNPTALKMVRETLTAMRLGGIWDHVGFGFHRYSTDKAWLLPHFEKMLYDQALIAMAYLETYQVTKDPFFARTAEEIFSYVLRDMTSPQGAFFSAEDADSEGEEGKFYVWSLAQFQQVLGNEEAALWGRIFNLRAEGNFKEEATGHATGANIPHLEKTLPQWAAELGVEAYELEQRWEKARIRLFETRTQRIYPLKDDKILADWNGLMIAALALGARVLGKPEYGDAAQRAACFIQTRMQKDGHLLMHRYREGEIKINGHADDYAFFIFGLLNLYGATFDPTWTEEAISLQERMLEDFWDKDRGGFFLTTAESDELPARPKALYDGAIPSANSIALINLLHLARLTGDFTWDEKAQAQIKSFSGTVKNQPTAFTHFLVGLDFALNPGQEVVITGDPDAPDTRALLSALNLSFAPNKVTLVKSDRLADRLAKIAGYTAGLQPLPGRATAHVCRNFACKDPTTDVDTLVRLIGEKDGL